MSVAAEGKPNLIPLLDMVLQLLMFFIICVNFVTEQMNADIKLPEAQSAKPMEKTQASDVLFVNLNYNSETGNHEVLILGQGSKSLLEARVLLRNLYEDKKREAKDETARYLQKSAPRNFHFFPAAERIAARMRA